MNQSIRDVVTGELSLEYFAKRFQEGWKVASVEWVRQTNVADVPEEPTNMLGGLVQVPYGFKAGGNGFLEESPMEASVLLLILDQVVKEKRIQEIASELNRQGYGTREGKPWSATDVFNLMPRLIEAGPALLKHPGWQHRRAAADNILGKAELS